MPPTPPALTALESHPALGQQVAASLSAQARRIAERMRHFVLRPYQVAEFDRIVEKAGGGLLHIVGPSGAGATSLLCYLAATRRYPFWLPSDDAGNGIAALCAQLIALHDLPLPLVPPAANRDADTLEQLIAEAAARMPQGQPLVILVDQLPSPAAVPSPLPFPTSLPPNVVIAYPSEDEIPFTTTTRLALPTSGPIVTRNLVEAAIMLGSAPSTAVLIVQRSQRSFLYVHLAHGLIKNGLLRRKTLPHGLGELHDLWWNDLSETERQLAQVLAAAGGFLPYTHAAELAGMTLDAVEAAFAEWGPLVERGAGEAAIYHPFTRAYIGAQIAHQQAHIHSSFVKRATTRSGGQTEQEIVRDDYAARELARHVGLSDAATRAQTAPLMLDRSWANAHERRDGTMRNAARDATWALRAAIQDGPLPNVVRSAIITATLTTQSRMLSPEAVAQAVLSTLERGAPRDPLIRRTRTLIDQLPDGRNKALVLRRLGEICYEQSMRVQAMRMLSEALDLEVPGLPRSWRDEREEAQVTLARAAITAGSPDMALGITVRITHPERRGLIETEVVRWLLARGMLTRAEEVAHAIGHEHTHEWAMAEVAAGHARSGHTRRWREVIGTLRTDTATAWARTELACDAARRGDTTAVEQVTVIAHERLRDRAMGLVSQSLVEGSQTPTAIIAARMIEDREVRARTLIELAMLQIQHAASALAHADEDVRALGGDERTPLEVLLAAAYATNGDLESALRVASRLSEGEERDRAHSRAAAALARQGDHNTAYRVAAAIPDDDERGWTFHELSRALAAAGLWQEAAALVAQIPDQEQRAKAEADLTIALARAGKVKEAYARVLRIDIAGEHARALTAMASELIRYGAIDEAIEAAQRLGDPMVRGRYGVALVAALATYNYLDKARAQALQIRRPLERARALVAIARVQSTPDPAHATTLLGEALRLAAPLGRAEMLTLLTSGADTLVALGGAELLLATAHALDEVDSWWS